VYSISPYNIAGLISEISEEVGTQIAKNCCRRQPHSHLRPRQEEPPRVLRFGRSRSFRVIQGRWFWYQSKARMRLPIIPLLWLWCYLAPFMRYGDLLAKNCLFFLPLSHSAPSLPMFPLEFCGEVKREETRVMGLSSSEDPMIVAWVVLTQCQRVTDRRTDLL